MKYRTIASLVGVLFAVVFMCELNYNSSATGSSCSGKHSYNDFVYSKKCASKDIVVSQIDDGFLADIQGHGRKSPGEIAYGKPGLDLDLLGHGFNTMCCFGTGVVLGDVDFMGGVRKYGMILRNGYIFSRSGVFLMGHGHFDDVSVLDADDFCGSINDYIQVDRINLINMWLLGRDGEILTGDSGVEGSNISMAVIRVQGDGFIFVNNNFVLSQDGGRSVMSDYSRKVNVFRSDYIGKYSLIEDLYAAGALYLSCADNATISNNIFTAKTKIPGAYAIILKHSKNVRITNNTFEGFTVPVLMDKYSSIIDDSGNIIKPDVTANDPDSKLYGLDVDISKLIKSKTKPWWKFWQ